MKDYLGLGNIGNYLGFGNIANKEREEFSYVTKIMTIQKQGNLCAKCHESFSKSRMPIFRQKNNDTPDNSEENCQALHPDCNDGLARKETSERTNSIKKEYPKLSDCSDNKFYNLDYNDLI